MGKGEIIMNKISILFSILFVLVMVQHIDAQDKSYHQEIQARLHKLGLYNGEIDGIPGKKTTDAIKQFQLSNSFKPTGKIGAIGLQIMFPPEERSENINDIITISKINDVLPSLRKMVLKRVNETVGLEVVSKDNPARINFGNITDDAQGGYKLDITNNKFKLTTDKNGEMFVISFKHGQFLVNSENEDIRIRKNSIVEVNEVRYKYFNGNWIKIK